MSMIDRGLDGMAFLSGQLGAMLRRRLRELGGIALLSLAMMAALALASWSVHDPSLSHATDARVHNLLGHSGAIAADLMMQLLGLGSLALLLPVGIWGYRLLGHRPLGRERLRVLVWLFGILLSAAFASCLPRGAHWPLPSGLGGVVGDALLRMPAMILGAPLFGLSRFVLAVVLGLAALFAFAVAAGFVWRAPADQRGVADDEEDEAEAGEDDDSAWVSLGVLIHTVWSFRARLGLLFRGRTPAAPASRSEIAPSRRIEPRFDGGEFGTKLGNRRGYGHASGAIEQSGGSDGDADERDQCSDECLDDCGECRAREQFGGNPNGCGYSDSCCRHGQKPRPNLRACGGFSSGGDRWRVLLFSSRGENQRTRFDCAG